MVGVFGRRIGGGRWLSVFLRLWWSECIVWDFLNIEKI